MRKPFYLGVFLFCLMFPTGISLAQEAIESLASGKINWSAGIVTAKGVGVAPPHLNSTLARTMAQRAAKSVGLRNLLETLKGVTIDSDTTVENYMVKDDRITAKVSGVLQGAKILDTTMDEAGNVEIQIGISLYGDMSNVLIPSSFGKGNPNSFSTPESPSTSSPKLSTPITPPRPIDQTPSFSPLPSKPDTPSISLNSQSSQAPEPYTGLIVDGVGLGLRPALIPRLLDEEGRELYASTVITRKSAIQAGVVGYSKDIIAASRQKRVTHNPLIVRGIEIRGVKKTDVILTNEDVKRIQQAEKTGHFLELSRVVIIYD